MSTVFADAYADVYDALYADKDYGVECDAIEGAFRRDARRPVHAVLDIGCGTAAHAVPLATRGYRVTGVDLSPAMLQRAAQRARNSQVELTLVEQDARRLRLEQTFDAALMMFAVLGYQHENDDVLAALSSCRRHLTTGGVLVFDVWYGPAVLSERPGPRVKEVTTPQRTILRATSSQLDVRRHLCTVDFRLWTMPAHEPAAAFSEQHTMRYFFPRELELFLQLTGFELASLRAFPDTDREPTDHDWNVLAVARAV